MRRLALLLIATAAVITLVVLLRAQDRPAPTRPAAIGSTPGTTSTSPPVAASSSASSTPPVYRSGTVTTRAHTDYGDVRVRVTVAHGRIVQATAVEVPHGNSVDVQLSKPAVRALEREVLRAQSADVDMVSGATFTSAGYLKSLQAALDRLS
jgi:uncharacterized protein with FMN-binding domain